MILSISAINILLNSHCHNIAIRGLYSIPSLTISSALPAPQLISKIMKIQNVDLMPEEYQALLEIVRVTLRSRSVENGSDFCRFDWYQSSPRMCVRLLEVLNPKSPHSAKHCRGL
jgi:hypothetical protein